ncbi:SDR family oxidoreductase [Kribbella sp. NBC_01505]|uniref:SDR family NAD(P)-dependent oxidoreductase n=1 Tax=Kribbella sp. NBC_01505 TaxID=2903580 RepID=UPI0038657C78
MAVLRGRTAVITGGSEGIGEAIADRFTAEGATVYVTGRDQSKLDRISRRLKVIAIRADVSVIEENEHIYDTVRARGDRIDVLVANAGIAGLANLDQAGEDFFDRISDTNFKGLYFTVQRALPLLNDGASIVLLSSMAHRGGVAGLSVYAATKAAVRSLARSLAAELAARNIRVNSLSPGHTETAAFVRAGGDNLDAFRSALAAEVPLGRVASPAEVAGAALFLASHDSSYITGIDLPVDGGITQL